MVEGFLDVHPLSVAMREKTQLSKHEAGRDIRVNLSGTHSNSSIRERRKHVSAKNCEQGKRFFQNTGRISPPVLLQELPDEALGQLARVAEELLVKVVVHGRDVSQSLLLGVAQER